MKPTVFSITSAVIFSGVVVNASPLFPVLHGRDVTANGGFELAGCYTEATNMRALTGSNYFDDLMTVDKCATACSSYSWFGVEYGRECYCGSSPNSGSVPTDTEDCNFSCPGNAAQKCGAGNRLNMYTKASSTATSTGTPVQTPAAYSSLGCYTEATQGRALAGKATADDEMDIDTCAEICSGYGFSMFGLEYYRECYCGNKLMEGSVRADEGECKYPCMGNSVQLCGGDWRLNVYQLSDTLTSSASTTSTSPAATSAPTAYTAEGCYTEASNGRALSAVAFYDDNMTTEKCAAVCSDYKWFGLEYGRECYCGDTINAGSVLTSISECSFPCPGASTQFCGAGNRLNMYQYGATPSASTTSSTIPSSSSSDVASSTSSLGGSSTSEVTTSSSLSSSSQSSTSTTTTTESSSQQSSSQFSTSLATMTSESSSQTTSSPSPSSTSSSESSSSSQTTSSSTTTSTTSARPACATPVLNAGFEGTSTPWAIKISSPTFLTYNLEQTGNVHSGNQQASITYKTGSPVYQTWFNQPITVCPNTVYNLSAWTRASVQNPGCNVYYYIGSVDGASIKIMSTTPSSQLGLNWSQATGTFMSGTTTELTFNVRLTCLITIPTSRSYFMDDISFVAV